VRALYNFNTLVLAQGFTAAGGEAQRARAPEKIMRRRVFRTMAAECAQIMLTPLCSPQPKQV